MRMERRIGGAKQQVQALTREGRMGRYSRSRATASFDVLEAGDKVEGCSIGFRFGFAGSNQ